MTKISQNINEICNRYANALILSSENKNDIKQITDDFNHFNKMLGQSNELKNLIENPLINSEKKSQTLIKLCDHAKYSKIFKGFLYILTKHGKILLHKKIFQDFKKIIDFKSGLTEIFITTSVPLDKKIEEEIKRKLSENLNLNIKMTKIVDKGIIGGVIIKIKSIMIDNSIKSKLTEFNI